MDFRGRNGEMTPGGRVCFLEYGPCISLTNRIDRRERGSKNRELVTGIARVGDCTVVIWASHLRQLLLCAASGKLSANSCVGARGLLNARKDILACYTLID